MGNIELLCVPLGCDKNLVDTEKMLGLLNGLDLTFTDNEAKTDVILANTCRFIGGAKEESVDTILEMVRYGERGQCRTLIAADCLVQRYRQEILDEVPKVDVILGTAFYEEIAKVLEQVLEGEGNTHIACFHGLEELPDVKAKRTVTTGGYYAFLRTSEGYDKRRTYCIAPYLRRSYHDTPIEGLVEEVSQLTRDGVEGPILVAQETILYGKDIYDEKFLPRFLHEPGEIPGIRWIRVQYCYPEEITDELIEAIRTEEKMCHYLDIPIQHASGRTLKRMGRKTNRTEPTERIGSLRRAVPDIAFRTTLISGFLGETESDHKELMDFVNETGFERLGVFTYSAEENTPAYSYPDQMPQELKEGRRGELMGLRQDIASEHCESMVGQVLMILIEGKVVDEPVHVGRTYMDAPNVDGMTFVSIDTIS